MSTSTDNKARGADDTTRGEKRTLITACCIGVGLALVLATMSNTAMTTATFLSAPSIDIDGSLVLKGTHEPVKVASAEVTVNTHGQLVTRGGPHGAGGRRLSDDDDAGGPQLVQTASSTVDLPLLAAPVVPEALLNRVETLTLRIFDFKLGVSNARVTFRVATTTVVNDTYAVFTGVDPNLSVHVHNGLAYLKHLVGPTPEEVYHTAALLSPDDPGLSEMRGELQRLEADGKHNVPTPHFIQPLCAAHITCSSVTVATSGDADYETMAREALDQAGFSYGGEGHGARKLGIGDTIGDGATIPNIFHFPGIPFDGGMWNRGGALWRLFQRC